MPSRLAIGRHTFFDVGPPNDFYEVLLVRPASNGTVVERITLTPPGDACIQSAKVEVATGSLGEAVADLLGKTNPCTISEKELRRERKRCKNCLVFSGANVAMQIQCGSQTRIIRADILDRDMFDRAPNTPEHTSWTMQLLTRVDQAVGPGVMEHPIFPIAEERKDDAVTQDSDALRDISGGKYDRLFQGAPDRPSDLYHAAQIAPPAPAVRLLSSTPFQPVTAVQPAYPPLARLARVEGRVTFTVDIDPSGGTTAFKVESGHPMLRAAAEEAVASWKFPKEAAGQRNQATIEFATNCPPRDKR